MGVVEKFYITLFNFIQVQKSRDAEITDIFIIFFIIKFLEEKK